MAPLSDALLPTSTLQALPLSRTRLAVFVPITLALFGVGVVLFGGISSRATDTAFAPVAVDPVMTGSIGLSAGQAEALKHLDD